MHRSRIQYIMTWVSLGALLISGLSMLVLSWNGAITGSPSPVLIVGFWLIMMAAGIYLFLLAVKKAHRLWIDDERRMKAAEEQERLTSPRRTSSPKKDRVLDAASSARKLVRRIPDEEALENIGPALLKNLAGELEIMSGVFYIRQNNLFEMAGSYAQALTKESFSFKEGEGLNGQAAANRQILVLSTLPEGYREVFSGLGKAVPSYLAIVPLVARGRTIALLECAGYRYEANDIEAMFKIFSRDLMDKIAPDKE